jgi:hypothetical protein
MQTTKIKSINKKRMAQDTGLSKATMQYMAFELISKENGVELFADIHQLFGSTVDLQVLLLDATITGDDNPVWGQTVSSARRRFYPGSMSENIRDIDFEGFR